MSASEESGTYWRIHRSSLIAQAGLRQDAAKVLASGMNSSEISPEGYFRFCD
jgi:hypothetical protein